MWSEWLARTLRPRPADTAAPAGAVATASAADEETGIGDVRPSTRELALAAQDEEERSLAAEV